MNALSSETLRILVVSPRERVRDQLGEALVGRIGDHRLFWVSQPELALVRALDLVPHVVFVDSDLEGTDEILLVRQIVTNIPGAAVIAMVEWDAMARASQVVLAGARGFITKPLHADDVNTTLRQVLSRGVGVTAETGLETMTEGRVVVFCAPKGGTGRTTLAVNTAVALHQLSTSPVVLVDADYAAPALDVALNLHSDRTVADLLPRLSQLDRELVSGVLLAHASGIKVLLAPPPAGLSSPISLPRVQQILVVLRRMFPWVLVDLGLPMDETAYAFLDTADCIIMSVLPEMVGLRNTRLMLNQFRGRGYSEDKVWLVLNRASMAGGVSGANIEGRLQITIKHRVPDDQPLATHAVNRGVPIVMSHRRSIVAKAIRGLAEDLIDELGSEEDLLRSAAKPRRHRARGLLRALLGTPRTPQAL